MRHVLNIPNWNPAQLNKLMRNHWIAMRLKKIDREMIHAYALAERIPVAKGKRVVHMLITLKKKRGRRPDADAFLKSTLDALVHARLLIDDSDRWCYWTAPKITMSDDKSWGTTIALEDLE